jgi:hypothetical protein
MDAEETDPRKTREPGIQWCEDWEAESGCLSAGWFTDTVPVSRI